MSKFWCFLGFHKWNHFKKDGSIDWIPSCKRCGKFQVISFRN